MATAAHIMMKTRSANQWSSITPLSDLPAWYEDAFQTVERLAHLPGNWDGYGSLDIQPPAKTAALELMLSLSVSGATAPHIAPLSEGGLQFEWCSGGRELELEITATGNLEFLTADQSGEMFEGPVSDAKKQIPLLIGWLKTGELAVTDPYLESQYAASPL